MDVHAYSGETTQELQRNMSPILIAHRGNTRGPKPEKENQPEYILQAIQEGFDVEIDVWMFTHISLDDQRESKEIWSEGKMPSTTKSSESAKQLGTRFAGSKRFAHGGFLGKPTETGIDVHAYNGGRPEEVHCDMELWLGHDTPQYQINLSFLTINEDRLWCHAKNFHALTFLIQHGFHTFSHDKDTHVLTSKGIIWAYIGKEIDKNTICVMPERAVYSTYTNTELRQAKGICTDCVYTIQNLLHP